MLWIALYLPALPVQIFARASAEATPRAVFEGHPRPRVIAVDAAAQALGVHPGEALAAARAIAPQTHFHPRDAALEAATLDEVAAACARFTPSLTLAACDTLLLEVSASLRLFGGREALLHALADTVAGLGLSARNGVAPTPLAAHWFACTSSACGDDWLAALDALPTAVLGVGTAVSDATLELLAELGLSRIADVRRLPREGLARRQAHAVLDALGRARGEQPDPRRWRSPPPRHEAVLVLPVATASTEPLLFGLSRLVAGLVAWLAGMHAGIDRFTLELAHVDRHVTRLDIVAGAPSRDAARLMLLARECLAMLALPSPVEALHLAADTPVTQAGRTPDLFGDPGQTRENAALLLARLRARLGEHAVRRIVPWPDHRPECASRMLPVDAPERAAAIAAVARPAWLLERPRPLDAPDVLERVTGPERIEAGWWDGADVRRDYFVVRTRNAALWWVFRDRADGGWYVHGYFG